MANVQHIYKGNGAPEMDWSDAMTGAHYIDELTDDVYLGGNGHWVLVAVGSSQGATSYTARPFAPTSAPTGSQIYLDFSEKCFYLSYPDPVTFEWKWLKSTETLTEFEIGS